jgi:hypothetical protein
MDRFWIGTLVGWVVLMTLSFFEMANPAWVYGILCLGYGPALTYKLWQIK